MHFVPMRTVNEKRVAQYNLPFNTQFSSADAHFTAHDMFITN
jgi:hypothetical protein